MSDLIQNLSNIPLDVSDPKFIFNNVIKEHSSIVTTLNSLNSLNNSLLRELYKAEYFFTDDIYKELIYKLSVLEVKSNLQPDISNFPSKIYKSDILNALINIGIPISYNIDDIFINLTILNDNDNNIDLKTLDINLDEEYFSLLPESVANIIVDLAYNNSSDTLNMPNDLMMNVLNNLLSLKKNSLIKSFDPYYYSLVQPFLDYQSFLEENEISFLINKLILIEKFFIETNIFQILLSTISHSNELLYSMYFKSVYHIKNISDINFKQVFSDKIFSPKIEELITRVLYFMNNTGSKDTSIKNIDTEIFASDSNEVIVI